MAEFSMEDLLTDFLSAPSPSPAMLAYLVRREHGPGLRPLGEPGDPLPEWQYFMEFFTRRRPDHQSKLLQLHCDIRAAAVLLSDQMTMLSRAPVLRDVLRPEPGGRPFEELMARHPNIVLPVESAPKSTWMAAAKGLLTRYKELYERLQLVADRLPPPAPPPDPDAPDSQCFRPPTPPLDRSGRKRPRPRLFRRMRPRRRATCPPRSAGAASRRARLILTRSLGPRTRTWRSGVAAWRRPCAM
jgi:hypothetical protein